MVFSMAEPYPISANLPRQNAHKPACPETRHAINFINFPLGAAPGSVTFAPPATRPALTLARLPAIRAA